jgi:hypothetical protein
MLEERQDEWRIEPLDLELRWSDFQPACSKADQELEGLRISLAGVWACAALLR